METATKSDLTAIILAGGKSSRMGQDKALIPVGGVPLLRKICLIAGECANQVQVITFWPERYASIIPNHCDLIREVLLPNYTQPHGPLVGFGQGLTQVNTTWVLLLACDLPFLTASVIGKWVNCLPMISEDIQAVLPRQNDRWEAVCGLYRSNCLSSLNQFIAQGGRAFQPWLKTIPVQKLIVDDPKVLFNCNNLEDLQQVDCFSQQ
jgi:molybdopterin-guanine dinucleotide biosynthesis protein A